MVRNDSFYSKLNFQIHKIGEEEVAKLLDGSSDVIRDLGLNMTFKYVKVFFVQMKISTVKKFKDIKGDQETAKNLDFDLLILWEEENLKTPKNT